MLIAFWDHTAHAKSEQCLLMKYIPSIETSISKIIHTHIE